MYVCVYPNVRVLCTPVALFGHFVKYCVKIFHVTELEQQ